MRFSSIIIPAQARWCGIKASSFQRMLESKNPVACLIEFRQHSVFVGKFRQNALIFFIVKGFLDSSIRWNDQLGSGAGAIS